MKKIFVFFLAILVMALFSVPAFAAQESSDGSLTLGATKTTTVRLSANVSAAYAAATLGVSYATITYNSKGNDKSYGTASDTTYIYYAATNKVSGWTDTDSSTFTSPAWQKIGE